MDSVFECLSYISRVSKEPVIINGEECREIVKGVKLSPRFFVKDSCNQCGRCCSNYNVVYTESHFKEVIQSTDDIWSVDNLDPNNKIRLLMGLKPVTVDINGKSKVFYTSPKTGRNNKNVVTLSDGTEKSLCKFVEEVSPGRFACSIHPIRSVTCKIPHMRFIYRDSDNITRLTVGPYPRNFNIKCPITFPDEIDEHSVQTRIADLKLLQRYADDLEIETYLPAVISYLEAGNRKPGKFAQSFGGRLFSVTRRS